ncbi:hypothetical protein [Tsukamurella soli]|uniref:Uncharacterized protein n=1 Tax=Tsukamurella soli TaxID=644556 RepID=A0ABP8K9K5_9ACTN
MRRFLPVASGLAGAAIAVGLIAAQTTVPMSPTDAIGLHLVVNSIANIPENLADIIGDLPANRLAGVDDMTEGLNVSGNWWQYQPGNVIGFDQGDLAKVHGLTHMLIPMPGVAEAIADQLSLLGEAEFPMTPGCTGIPGPCNSSTYWTPYFTVAPWTLLSGYRFGRVVNTIDSSVYIPWSNTIGRFDPFAVVQALWDALTGPPSGVESVPSRSDSAFAHRRLDQALSDALNPFVPGTYCLPCQAEVPGAPDSLSRVPLFGEWYTFLDLGQEFTPTDRPGHPDPTFPDGNVDALSVWTTAGQQRLWSDVMKSATDPAYSASQFTQARDLLRTEATNYGPWVTGAPTGIARAGTTVSREWMRLQSDVLSSLGPPSGSARDTATRLGVDSAAPDEIPPAVPPRSAAAVTSVARALQSVTAATGAPAATEARQHGFAAWWSRLTKVPIPIR